MELDAGCVGGIVHKGVHAGLIFSTEGEDYGESISFLEDRLGFQWNRVIAAVGGAAILLGRKHGGSAFRFAWVRIFVHLDAVVDVRSIKSERDGLELFSATGISADGENVGETFSIVQIQGGSAERTIVLIVVVIVVGFLQIKGIGEGVFPVIQRLVLVGDIEISAVAEAGTVAVFCNPGPGRGRTAALFEVVGGIVVIPAHQSDDVVVVGGNSGVIITAAVREITAVVVKSGGDSAVFHDELFHTVKIRCAHKAGILKMSGVLIGQGAV